MDSTEITAQLPSQPWEASRLTPSNRKIIDLALEGFGPGQIARMLGRSPAGIRLILSSAIVQDELARRREQKDKAEEGTRISCLSIAKETLEQASIEAAEKLREQIDSADPKLAQAACAKILDTAFKAGAEGGGVNIGTLQLINAEQVTLLQKTLNELRTVETSGPEMLKLNVSEHKVLEDGCGEVGSPGEAPGPAQSGVDVGDITK